MRSFGRVGGLLPACGVVCPVVLLASGGAVGCCANPPYMVLIVLMVGDVGIRRRWGFFVLFDRC